MQDHEPTHLLSKHHGNLALATQIAIPDFDQCIVRFALSERRGVDTGDAHQPGGTSSEVYGVRSRSLGCKVAERGEDAGVECGLHSSA